ncbi:MAG: hypothetical protein LC722_08685 [Actinobacteria bacterium]|nr:hypothetical protein [Actinomycetota bacterium]
MNVAAMGHAGLTGMKGKLVSKAAGPVSRKTGLDEQRVLAVVGWIFLGLWAWQTFKFARSVVRAGREEVS